MARHRLSLVFALYLLAGIGGGVWHTLEQCHHSHDEGAGVYAAHEGEPDDHHGPLCPSHRDCRTCSLLQANVQFLPTPDPTTELVAQQHAPLQSAPIASPQAGRPSSRAPPARPS